MEGSLKLKEISYIHSEAYAAGELKHGTISLITDNVPVIGLVTQSNLIEKTVSNLKEVNARNARVLAICTPPAESLLYFADDLIVLPQAPDEVMPSLSVIPLQLISCLLYTSRCV